MRSDNNRKLITKIEAFLESNTPPMNDLLYALVQLDLGLYEPQLKEEGREIMIASDGISKDDARVFFNTEYKDEFVKAFNKKYRDRLKWEFEQPEWNQLAYEDFCKRFGVKP